MNAWKKNAIKNLLPLSEEKENFNIALKEWSFTGETVDYELADEYCQLCEMDGLRYHFQISNSLKNILWVGSKCIERFDIVIIDEQGTEVETGEKEKYLKNRLKDKHIEETLFALSQAHNSGTIKGYQKSYLDQYCIAQIRKFNITARILNYIFLRLDEEYIYYNKRFFGLDIRSKLNKEKLLSLNLSQFERIKNSLSDSQISFYKKSNA